MPSRSRSRSPRRSRSRSRDRSHSRSISRRRSRSRSRSTSRRRSRSPVVRSRTPPKPRIPAKVDTNSKDPELMKSRVFVGNLPTDNAEMTCPAFEDWFKKHGEILAVSLHKGFGFIQFKHEDDARAACTAENGSLFNGFRMDVKMAMEGKKKPAPYRPGSPPGGNPLRERPPRDWRDDPFDRRPPPPPDAYRRGPPMDDPYRRFPPPNEPPFRREPYGPDPYRDPYPGPPPPSPYPPIGPGPGGAPPLDAMIYIMDRSLRAFGDMLERRLKAMNMICDNLPLTGEMTVKGALESCTRRGILYAIFANEQNEVHRSITLNILVGTPQEHRNMPLDDAMNLLARNFEKYMQQSREKAAPRPGEVMPPDPDVAYLLNLLADGRHLTLEEIDKVRDFIADRRSDILKDMGRNNKSASPPKEDLKKQQANLQAKILSILNPGGEPQEDPKPKQPTDGLWQARQQAPQQYHQAASSDSSMTQLGPRMPQAMVPRQAPPVQTPQQQQRPQPKLSTNQLNLDNPNIQKALNNLIQSGPDLMRNIASVNPQQRTLQQQQQQNHMQQQHQQQMRARMMGPGAGGGMVRGHAPPPPPGPPGPNAIRPLLPY